MAEKRLRGVVGAAWLSLMVGACTEAPAPEVPPEAVRASAAALDSPEAQVEQPTMPPPIDELEKDVPWTNLSASRGSQMYWMASVPEGVKDLKFTITGGTGDADLYVRFNNIPTTSLYDCRPYKTGNEEECVFPAPAQGTWWVVLRGFTNFSGVTLRMTWKGGYIPLEPGVEVTGLSGAAGSSQMYTVRIPEREDGGERNVHVRLRGSGNADLYVQRDAEPTRSAYDCRGMNEHSTENCNLNGFAPGRYFVEVFGAREGYSDGSLLVTYD